MSDFNENTAPLIDASELRQALHDPQWRVFDVRHSLSDPQAGYRAYQQAHIPSARFLRQDTELSGTPNGKNGRHPLPDREHLRELLRSHGVNAATHVVVYDDNTSAFAARAWWLLRWLGHQHVYVLDGGWQAWQALDARPLPAEAGADEGVAQRNAGSPSSATGTAVPAMPTIDAATLETALPEYNNRLIDAREPARFQGRLEPLDPVAGHIPGALNRPVGQNLQPDGRFKPANELYEEFSALLDGKPASALVHYCGSGISACHNILAMEIAGLPGSVLYPGSWSEWCSDASRALARQ